MRYQSFYPFSQQQQQQQSSPIPQQFQPPRNNFLRGLSQSFGAGNTGAPQGPNSFPGGAPSQSPTGMSSAGTPQLSNRMEQYLQTADQFLSTAQRLTPMVQQVAPMVQNIPALWKIYRGFQSMPDATSTASAVTRSAGAVASSVPRPTGSSIPRIFQPPL
ncbi:VrrA/YqfQ family protein [Paenisporosarcina sp. OV554]|uniref:VrrA/YqfQ family protein n=1 Tax=Paenisporosarcina sp. OV554 TaxID=2135694 RepID=UPI000D39843D|nr:VrrA/YqfQ family protein [Paenisporosarcina sp. OV554]PUB12553.1 YqfQ-like protein [Paenisporosarcina sp. OV554]